MNTWSHFELCDRQKDGSTERIYALGQWWHNVDSFVTNKNIFPIWKLSGAFAVSIIAAFSLSAVASQMSTSAASATGAASTAVWTPRAATNVCVHLDRNCTGTRRTVLVSQKKKTGKKTHKWLYSKCLFALKIFTLALMQNCKNEMFGMTNWFKKKSIVRVFFGCRNEESDDSFSIWASLERIE